MSNSFENTEASQDLKDMSLVDKTSAESLSELKDSLAETQSLDGLDELNLELEHSEPLASDASEDSLAALDEGDAFDKHDGKVEDMMSSLDTDADIKIDEVVDADSLAHALDDGNFDLEQDDVMSADKAPAAPNVELENSADTSEVVMAQDSTETMDLAAETDNQESLADYDSQVDIDKTIEQAVALAVAEKEREFEEKLALAQKEAAQAALDQIEAMRKEALSTITSASEEQQKSINELNEQLEQMSAESEKLKQENIELKAAAASAHSQKSATNIIDRLTTQTDSPEQRENLSEIESQILTAQRTLDEKNHLLTVLIESIASLKEQEEQLNGSIEGLKEERSTLEKEGAQAKAASTEGMVSAQERDAALHERDTANSRLTNARADLRVKVQELEESKGELSKVKQELEQANEILYKAKVQYNRIKAQFVPLNTKYYELHAEHKNLKEAFDNKSAENTETKEKLSLTQARLSALTSTYQAEQSANEQLVTKLDRERQRNAELSAQLEQAQHDLAKAQVSSAHKQAAKGSASEPLLDPQKVAIALDSLEQSEMSSIGGMSASSFQEAIAHPDTPWVYDETPSHIEIANVHIATSWLEQHAAIVSNVSLFKGADPVALRRNAAGAICDVDLQKLLGDFLYASYVNRTALLVAGPCALDLAQALSIGVNAQEVAAVTLGEHYNPIMIAKINESAEQVITLNNVLSCGYREIVLQALEHSPKHLIYTHTYAEDLAVEPKGIFNFVLPLFTEFFVHDIPAGEIIATQPDLEQGFIGFSDQPFFVHDKEEKDSGTDDEEAVEQAVGDAMAAVADAAAMAAAANATYGSSSTLDMDDVDTELAADCAVSHFSDADLHESYSDSLKAAHARYINPTNSQAAIKVEAPAAPADEHDDYDHGDSCAVHMVLPLEMPELFAALRLSPYMIRRLTILLSDTKKISTELSETKDIEVIFGLLPLAIACERSDVLETLLEEYSEHLHLNVIELVKSYIV